MFSIDITDMLSCLERMLLEIACLLVAIFDDWLAILRGLMWAARTDVVAVCRVVRWDQDKASKD